MMAVVFAVGCHSNPKATSSNPYASQKGFTTPQEASDALVDAASHYNVPDMIAILGPDGKDLVASQDQVQDKNRAAAFVAKAREKETVEVDPKNDARATLIVGKDDWPLPIPIVKSDSKWYFDVKAGHDEILNRRIGANELDVITVCRGYVEAQRDYAEEVHDKSGVNQFAQQIISSPGKHDGLAWRNEDGSWGGPVGEAAAKAIAEGYAASQPFHGYYFKVLKGQGPAAPLGQLDYMVGGAMIGGFALVAWPAEYEVTGVQTFMVSNDGKVYQKDMGDDTSKAAAAIERFDPDSSWKQTEDAS
jgi:hypothetical protein